MSWLLFRLHRKAILIWVSLVVLIAAVIAVLWWQVSGTVASVQSCLTQLSSSSHATISGCSSTSLEALDWFTKVNRRIQEVLLAFPLLMGVFVGAPLMGRELENRTHRLVWTQGVTPMRWLASNVASTVGFCGVLATVLALVTALWLILATSITSAWGQFDLYPPVFVSYVVFAVTLGLAVATVTGRTVAAMAVTGLIWLGTRAAFGILVRPMLLPPLIRRGMTAGTAGRDWLLGITYVNSNGQQMSESQVDRLLQQWGGGGADPVGLLQQHGIFISGLYQPASRFWVFQGMEAAVFILFSAACVGMAVAWVRLRLASE